MRRRHRSIRYRLFLLAAAGIVLRSWPAEIALIDIGMPEIDGYALARIIRNEIRAELRPRMAAITGYGSTEDRERSREAGFDAHLVKPVNAQDLQSFMGET
jgi:CheY-like chemotaxis protein